MTKTKVALTWGDGNSIETEVELVEVQGDGRRVFANGLLEVLNILVQRVKAAAEAQP